MVEEIQNQIRGIDLRWFGHIKRMDEQKIPERLLEMNMS
jgi:hypothetical protein